MRRRIPSALLLVRPPLVDIDALFGAERALQRALTMDPNNPMPHHLLGQVYRDMGRTGDAERELNAAGQLEERQNAKP